MDIHPRTRQWIVGVAIGFSGLFLFLSLLGQAGPAGRVVEQSLFALFGWGTFLTPVFAGAIALIFFATERKAGGSSFVGGALLFIALLGLLAVFGDEEARRGGIVGRYIGLPVHSAVGVGGAALIFVGLGLVGGLVLLNYPAARRAQSQEEQEHDRTDRPAKSAAFAMLGLLGRTARGLLKKPSLPKIDMPSFPAANVSKSDFKLRPLERQGVVREVGEEAPFRSGLEDAVSTEALKIPYTSPPLTLFDGDKGKPTAGDIRANMAIIQRTLADFGIEVEMGDATVGPTVTQYTLKPSQGVKLSKITNLSNDLALALAAHPIRIEAPIPGRSLVGIEVPNKQVAIVRLRALLEEQAFRVSPYRLAFALGRDVAGAPVYAALEKMPHLLIAGATGTGKTIALNTILMSLLSRNAPAILRLLLVDPKRVEFPIYNGVPHLLTPVIVDVEKTVNALRWAVGEMERRFDVLSGAKARDIGMYNQGIGRGEDPMPYIIVVIDELADLMAARGREVEAAIVRLAQMARAVGIHLVVATQRPSVEVITGLIKANITSRMAFQVASQVDSRTVLDASGSEKLLGNGDMLFVSAETSKPRRIQGSYVSEKEVRRVTDFLKRGRKPEYEEGVTEHKEGETEFWEEGGGSFGELDPLYEEAKRLVIQSRKASASYLQRRLRVGYARAARIIDLLEEHGVVGPGEGAKPRELLIGADGRMEEEELEEE
ncbi:MAG: hypothetical protein A2806_03655 [Candidatus Terrybacteria bacterium RIFCSPHIGHO2_01_FULL_48_17]|uniref:FtsK domain-containing protein n=1 Tax=Candidatus Terrybacteria bacterium RIFCSPHIGHO2_01_FULL_48_17 TaxID=1802362 RepID=A0A1G2PH69_9BACT|nr:MAG: hypothetical protein A2806_03655 [Candidatus Terrybacteria bacterium RIFCSPHIGHO2_01_FULL_48_17]OHA53158.1 MAG: hypothetical protein A3A30_01805 [Candidatus Terrybacteria bacterium RIFCSPLOWO2_01_FULL_48_14]